MTDKQARKGISEVVHYDLPTKAKDRPPFNFGGVKNDHHPAIITEEKDHHHHIMKQRSFSNLSSNHGKSILSGTGDLGNDYSPMSYHQNTYNMDSKNPFDVKKVRQLVNDELAILVKSKTQEHAKMPTSAECLKTIESIKLKVKSMGFDRYRHIVNITVSENYHQTMRIASRFFWDVDRDKYISQTITNKHFHLVCVVYAVYFE
ncbi:dynein light chain Tctex-type protein 2B-like [Clytia hemisphaerica]|uniref:dynein light chain Tctex-type protein 2B-like n=1 Tax=Clytia hemisphaerica TaxID=252671 RepID=UPI0034D51943